MSVCVCEREKKEAVSSRTWQGEESRGHIIKPELMWDFVGGQRRKETLLID